MKRVILSSLFRRITLPAWQFKGILTIFLMVGFVVGSYLTTTNVIIPALFAAGDLNNTWDFSADETYTLGDSTQIEVVSDTSARLSVRNYASDGNTAALYHLDETSGTSVTDSSDNAVAGTATAANWEAGNLNNAFRFNGSSDNITIPDSAATSFEQTHTLEAWVKLDQALSAGSHFSNQPIVDKGDYSLYIDSETGKITYEISSSSSPTWSQKAGTEIAGSWSFATHDSVKSIVGTSANNLYAGLAWQPDDAEVWHYDGSIWTKIGGDSINASWGSGYDQVQQMVIDGDILYVALGDSAGEAEVWQWQDSTWTKIGDSDTLALNLERVSSMTLYDSGSGDQLYIGTGISTDDGRVYRWDGANWTQIAGLGADAGYTSWGNVDDIDYVMSLTSDSTYLYAGLGVTTDDGEVWRFDGSAGVDGQWTRIGGNGADAGYTSWGGADDIEAIYSLTSDANYLYAGTGVSTDDAEVWRFDKNTETWTLIAGNGAAGGYSSWTGANNLEATYSLAVDTDYLYAGLGNSNDDGEVWRFDKTGGTWTKIGGDGLNAGWTNANNTRRVESLVFIDSVLYAGIYNNGDNGEVWTWNGVSWTQIGGSYINESWGFWGIDRVQSMTTSGGNLYAGLGTGPGEGMVWEYDGTSWRIVGGQGVKNSWPAETIEYVTALTGSGGDVYAGLGATTDDGQVWKYSNGSWVQIAGKGADPSYTSWGDADNIEYVYTLVEDPSYVYAGTGNSTDDGEVWRFDKTLETWTLIGGNGSAGGYASWTGASNIEEVISMASDGTNLYAGLGRSAGDGEVWRWNGSTWTKIGGDGINSGWATGFDGVYAMAFYKGQLYVGLGISGGEAEVWRWNGTSWAIIGGDSTAGSWDNVTYEQVQSMVVYNGKLYAGLGTGAGEGEVWEYNGSTWTQVGGDSLNSGFDATIEEIQAMAVYNGSLYAALGNTGNADAEIWSYGNKSVLQSATSTFDTNWHHIAATYSGSQMRIYINGVQDAAKTVAQFVNDSDNPLMIGSNFGSTSTGNRQAHFDGLIDEVRLSDIARTSFITDPYATSVQIINPSVAAYTSGVKNWEDFIVNDSAAGGTITYRLSNDGGSTWKYWNGSSWVTSSSTSEANSEAVVDANIATFPVVYDEGIIWQAILSGNGDQQVSISSVQITATSDTTDPSNPTLLTALSQSSGGTSISSGGTYAFPNPYFSWSGAADTGGVGVYGYYVYFGTDPGAEPTTAGSLQTASTFTSPNLTNGETYYLKIKTVDKAKNITNSSWPVTVFEYTYATSTPKPNNVDYISTASGTFGNITDMKFSWPTTGPAAASPYDGGPAIVGWQYAVNNTDNWLGTYTDVDLGIDYIPLGYSQPHSLTEETDGDYIIIGDNTIYFRAVDADGNTSEEVAGILSYGGAAPTFTTACTIPNGITITPTTSTSNSFALSWAAATPDDDNFVEHYYYMVNISPPSTLSTITSNTARYIDNGTSTSVSASNLSGAVKGSNTVYVVPVDDEGNYAASNCLKGTFTLDSTFPDPPKDLSITDASVKATSLWRASLAWDVPEYTGTGELTYKIQRSTDGTTWTNVATTTGTAYVDTVTESQTYYWRVGTYDTSSESQNAPSYANAVTLIPKGSYTEPAGLSSGPAVSSITTKKATVTWTTDRASDTKVQYGTSSGNYFEEEPSNSIQSTGHTLLLNNLEPGTTYYYKAKWTDEDGNTGTSDEQTFTTDPAPTVTEPTVDSVGLSTASITFTVSGASSAKVYYGKTSAFGGVVNLGTSTVESTYTVTLDELEDGTKYFYKINTFDTEDAEYEGSILTFETLPRPQLTDVRIQQVKGTAQPTILVSWSSNTDVSSIVTYYPEGNAAQAKDEVNVDLVQGEHQMVVRGLLPNTPYTLIVKGRDKLGNEAISDPQRITTATDTRPPKIQNLKIESSLQKNTGDANVSLAQLIVSWDTDEPATSQVEYGEGTGTTYSQKSQEDSSLTSNHVVIISGLTPSKVYHLRALSKDSVGNEGTSVDTVTITPKVSRSALDLVIANLSEAFGFLKSVR